MTAGGRGNVLKKLASYNSAARFAPWFVLVDLDNPTDCVRKKREAWLPRPEPMMVFRIAVVELEAWLLADREAVAEFLAISASKIPPRPDELPDPKRTLLNLARRSRRREIREGLAPRENSGASVGPTYVSDINDFGATRWRPRVAASESPSLARCLRRLDELRERLA